MKKFLLPLILMLSTFALGSQTINCSISATQAQTVTSLICNPAPINQFTATFPATVFAVSVAVAPTSATITEAGTQLFTATVSNASNTAVTWSATGGTITSGGLYTAGNSPGSSFTVTATSVQDVTKSATAAVTIIAPPPPAPTLVSITVTPSSQTVNVGTAAGFTSTNVYSDGSTKNTTGSNLWVSSNSGIASLGTLSTQQFFNCLVAGTVTVTSSDGPRVGAISGSGSLTCFSPPPPPPQIIIQSFDGDIGAGTSSNPDHPNMGMASNGTYVMEATWQHVNIYNLTGTLQSSTATLTFFNNASIGCSSLTPGEPRILYDEFISRWVLSTACSNGDFIIVSSGSDPTTSTWKGTTLTSNVGDVFMIIGYDKNWFGESEFQTCSGANASVEVAIPNADLAWSGAGTIVKTHEVTKTCQAYDAVPEIDHNASKGTTSPLYFVSRVGETQNQTNAALTLAFDRFTPTTSTAGAFSTSPLTLATPYLYNTPVDVSQPSTPGGIRSTESHRPWSLTTSNSTDMQLVWGSGPCSTAGTCATEGVNTHQHVLWFDVATPGLTLIQSAKISDSSLGFLFPTLGVDGSGNTVITATGSSTTQFASIYAWTHLSTDLSGVVNGPTLLTAGAANYQVCNTTPHPGWGTYGTSQLNVADTTKIFVVAEYAKSATLCAWATRIFELQPAASAPPPPTLVSISVAPVNPTAALGASVSYTATGTYSDSSTQDVTLASTWIAGTPANVTMGSPITNPELGTCNLAGTSVVTATVGAISGHTTQTCIFVPPSSAYNPYCGAGNVPKFGSTDGPANLPQACINTAETSTPAPGSVTPVANGGNLQTAINNANCGDTLSLAAGAVFSGTYTLPNKACDDSHWIVIRSATADSSLPAEGSRLTPCYAGVSSLPGRPSYPCPGSPPVLTAQITEPSLTQGPLILSNGANHYRLGPGLEITRAAGTSGTSDVLTLVGLNGGTADKIVLDRVWIHGTVSDETDHAFAVSNITNVALIDSTCTDIHTESAGVGVHTESQCVAGGLGGANGPVKVEGNFLEAGGEEVFSGGGGAIVVSNDWEIDRNHFFLPLTWMSGQPGFTGGRGGHPWVVKNLLEMKNAIRVFIEGNLFENIWGGFSQNGYVVLLTPKNQSPNLCPICETDDVTFRYNAISGSGAGISFATVAATGGGDATDGQRYSFHDFTLDNLNPAFYAGGSNGDEIQVFNTWSSSGVLKHILLNHVTMLSVPSTNGNIIQLGNVTTNPPMFDFVWQNSIIQQNLYSVWSTGGTTNCAASDVPITSFNSCFPGTGGYSFAYNAIINVGYGGCDGHKCTSVDFPATNLFPASGAAVGFTNYNNAVNGITGFANYQLLNTSPYRGAGNDGKDLGANIPQITSLTTGVY